MIGPDQKFLHGEATWYEIRMRMRPFDVLDRD